MSEATVGGGNGKEQKPMFIIEEAGRPPSMDVWRGEANRVLANFAEKITQLEIGLRKEIQNRKYGQSDIRRQIDEMRGKEKINLTERMNHARESHLPEGYVIIKSYLTKNLLGKLGRNLDSGAVTDLVNMGFFPSAKRIFGEDTRSAWIVKEEEAEKFVLDRLEG